MWLVFSDTWNAILDELRSIDLLSERERRNLIFLHLPIDDTIEVRIKSIGVLSLCSGHIAAASQLELLLDCQMSE